jgi:hypothetical protein
LGNIGHHLRALNTSSTAKQIFDSAPSSGYGKVEKKKTTKKKKKEGKDLKRFIAPPRKVDVVSSGYGYDNLLVGPKKARMRRHGACLRQHIALEEYC